MSEIDDHNQYPDCNGDGLGDLNSIDRIKELGKRAPKIKWGHVYDGWPMERKLKYAEDLAASMNQAADILQQERDALRQIANSQEEKLIAAAKAQEANFQMVQTELTHSNAKQQELNEIIVQLTTDLKTARKRIKSLESDREELENTIDWHMGDAPGTSKKIREANEGA